MFTRILQDEPLFTFTGLAMLALCIPTLLLMYADTRIFEGVNVWVKPLKFQLSLALFLLTLAFFAHFLPEGMTKRVDYKIYAALVVVCIVAEIIWICGAATFATASHFNTTPFMSAVYGLMGVAAVILLSATLVYGIAMLRAGLSSPLIMSISISLILTFVLTVIVAFRLASNGSHFVGEMGTGKALMLTGWSMETGDLRVPHFFATHAMHFIPAVSLGIYIIAPTLLQHTTVIVISAFYIALTWGTFAQALAGRPFLS